MHSLSLLLAAAGLVSAQCPYMTGELPKRDATNPHESLEERQFPVPQPDAANILREYTLNDTDVYLTSDVGGPIPDQNSLQAGERGPTLLEDFIFRQKITHFDHERVPERAVHARGAGAHGVFESYGDFSNITGASFLNKPGKKTPVFVRFSTVAGSRGSADTARDVHGFATRFYTDEGNFDIVGNNIPVFFIQDAILFPDLIHAVKPSPDSEMPQAATAHDSAWDFFSQQPSTLHTLFWAMAQHGIVRSFRQMDGFGVHTFRFVTDAGESKLVKFHFTSVQGKASLLWEEAQQVAGQNADFLREDLFNAIAAGRFPEWEFGVQVMDESDALKFGFDVMDPTKIVPEELVPITKLGKMTLNRNPTNYFAETEQVMFQPGHLVRGIDFSEDPLLQGRIFSYLDTQLNRHGGPNFEQIPINRPVAPIHNNNRDGAGQMFVHANTAAYSPNTLNSGAPKQPSQQAGRGFFTSPAREVTGKLTRGVSPSLSADYWSQPRLFFNSITKEEQQFLINAIRFETAHLKSATVKKNVLTQLNKISNEIASQVAEVLGMPAPAPDPKFYHTRTTKNVSVFKTGLKKLDGLKVGLLSTVSGLDKAAADSLRKELAAQGVDLTVVAEILADGVDMTYSSADAIAFDGIIVADKAASLFASRTGAPGNSTMPGMKRQAPGAMTSLYPPGRPAKILVDAYNFAKPIAGMGGSGTMFRSHSIAAGPGVYGVDGRFTAGAFLEGLKQFKFFDRFN
ncbi:catalase-domain-containing protein [Aulographum hederae CBS 113979]|uniref:Catalase n=1 Tax=Aulographum hederae CBS 113979 TaxID=1176131 RepID=A0A6G1GKR8_9PEZI|nr:catalase-domain-containing protein [Aulographum hederae CBS 113979]